LDWFIRDLRVALRLLVRDRAFSLTAASTLAICIAANAALFTVVHHVLLRPLPVPASSRILLMSNIYPKAGATDSSNSGVPDYYDRLAAVSVLEEQAVFNQRTSPRPTSASWAWRRPWAGSSPTTKARRATRSGSC
jgi:hypothetical protein